MVIKIGLLVIIWLFTANCIKQSVVTVKNNKIVQIKNRIWSQVILDAENPKSR